MLLLLRNPENAFCFSFKIVNYLRLLLKELNLFAIEIISRHEKTREQCSRKFFQTAEIICQYYRYSLRQICGNSFSTFKYKLLIIISTVENFSLTRILGQA